MKVSAMFQLINMCTVFTCTAPGVLMVVEHQYLLWVAVNTLYENISRLNICQVLYRIKIIAFTLR